MFPAVTISPLNSDIGTRGIRNQPINELLEVIGFHYARGLSKQIIDIQKITERIFIEIDADISKLSARLKKATSQASSLKSKAISFMNNRKPLTQQEVEQYKEKEVEIPPIPHLSSTTPGQSDYFISHIARGKVNPLQSFSHFQSIIPEYKDLELEISDPNFYKKQLRDELASDFKNELNKKNQNKPNRQERSHTIRVQGALQHYLEEIPIPTQTIGIPPPPGKTEYWRNKTIYQPRTKQINNGTAVQTDPLPLSFSPIDRYSVPPTIVVTPTKRSADYSKELPTLVSSHDSIVSNEFIDRTTSSISEIHSYEVPDDESKIFVRKPSLFLRSSHLVSIEPKPKETPRIHAPPPKEIHVAPPVTRRTLSVVSTTIFSVEETLDIVHHKEHSTSKSFFSFGKSRSKKREQNISESTSTSIDDEKLTTIPSKDAPTLGIALPPPPPPPPPPPSPIKSTVTPNAGKVGEKPQGSSSPASYLDEIKNGNFKLKKVVPTTNKNKPIIKPQDQNVDELSIAELQVALAHVRLQVQVSSSSSQSESDSSSVW